MKYPIIKINNRIIGHGRPTFIIAEIGINHNGSLKNAKELINLAVLAGADAVKFQKRSLKHLYKEDFLENPNIGEQSFQYMIPLLKEWELDDSEYKEIRRYCDKKNTIFLCSPWDIISVDFLESLEVPAYKIASADLTNFPLLEYVASKNKPIILSTGMSFREEIDTTVDFLKKRNVKFALLHCNSSYPTPFEEINLKFIRILRKFNVPVGYSGHERGISISTVAAALGACIIERHITLDRTMEGPDHAASLEPQGFQKMVRDIRQMEIAMGSGRKYVNRMEMLNRELLGKSLIALVDIFEGMTITKKMIGAKSPARGISPQNISKLIGKVAQRNIERDEFFIPKDLGIDSDYKFKIVKKNGKWGFVFRLNEIEKNIKEVNSPQVEIRLSDKDLDLSLPKLGQYRQVLRVHAPEYWHKMLVDPSSFDEVIRERSMQVIQEVINKTVKISEHFQDIPKIIVHPGGMSMEYMGRSDELNNNLKKSLKQLKTKGTVILLENMPPRPWFFGGEYFCNSFLDAEEIKNFCIETGNKICFDISHSQLYCNLKGHDIVEQIKKLLPFIEHWHIADAYGIHGEGVQIGEGDVNFNRVIPLIKNSDKTWTLEIWRGHHNNFEGYYMALEKLSKYSL